MCFMCKYKVFTLAVPRDKIYKISECELRTMRHCCTFLPTVLVKYKGVDTDLLTKSISARPAILSRLPVEKYVSNESEERDLSGVYEVHGMCVCMDASLRH
jgi:hypothetical protein